MAMNESSLAHLTSVAARRSSLFSREGFQEEMLRRREGNRSVVSMSKQPEPESTTRNRPKVLYENTYQLGPKRKFKASEAKAVIESVLESTLKTEKYDPKTSAYNSTLLAQLIKDQVKELNYERYKILVIASIGQLNDQGLQVVSRCVWDTNFDTSASASYKNKSLFAVATVFAVYLE